MSRRRSYARGTSVSVERSEAELRKLLKKYGAHTLLFELPKEKNMSSDAVVTISAGIITRELEKLPDDTPVDEVVRRAFEECLKETNTWLLADDDPKFRAGCGALLLYYHERDVETFARVEAELKGLQAVSALFQGLPVDLERVEVPDDPLGLVKVYREVKGE